MKYLLIIIFTAIIKISSGQVLEIYEEIKDYVHTGQMEIIAGLEEAGNIESEKKNEESKKITKELIEQNKTLKELKSVLESVSSAIKQYTAFKDCLFYLKETVALSSEINKGMRKTVDGVKLYTTNDIIYFNNYMFSLIKSQKENLKDIKLITGKDVKMSEGQRIKLIYKTEDKMGTIYGKMYDLKTLLIY